MPEPDPGRPAGGSVRGGLALAVAGGLVASLSVPPAGWWPLGPVGVAGLALAAWRLPERRHRALAGLLWACSLFFVTCAWMVEFHVVGLVVLTVALSGYTAVAVALSPTGGPWRGVGLAGALTLAEALRSRFPFQGFPMGGLPVGQAGGPGVALARLGGTTLLTLATCLAGVALAEALRRRSRAAAALALPVLAVGGACWLLPDGPVVGRLDVAAVQGGGPRGTRAAEDDAGRVFDRHLAVSRSIAPGPALVLWPENAVTTDGPFAGSPEEALLQDEARRLGATLFVGVVEDAGPGRFRNAQVAIDPTGTTYDRYDKVHRVPFGEYVPLRPLVTSLGVDLSLLPSDAVPGEGPGRLDTSGGAPTGVLISYEVFFGDRNRSAVRNGAALLLVPTNAASYTTSQVPDQEVAAARLRAVEAGRDLVQAAPTGFSAWVGPRGAVRAKTDLGAPAVVRAIVPLRSGTTPYVRSGDRPWLALAGVAAAAPALAALATRRRPASAHR